MRDLDDLFAALSQSTFRRRQHLDAKDLAYLTQRTLPVVLDHARQFVLQRLAPARPVNDGRQTPMRGHPVFVAQHGTATCCRGCLAKWHHIPAERELSTEQIDYVVRVIEQWLVSQGPERPRRPDEQPRLFEP